MQPSTNSSGGGVEPWTQRSAFEDRALSPSLSSSSKTPSDPDPASCSDVSSLDDFELVDEPDHHHYVEHSGVEDNGSLDDGDNGLSESTFSRLEPDWRDNSKSYERVSHSLSRTSFGSSTPMGSHHLIPNADSFSMAESALSEGPLMSTSPETGSTSNSFRFPDPEASIKGSEVLRADDDESEDEETSEDPHPRSPLMFSSRAARVSFDVIEDTNKLLEIPPFQAGGPVTRPRPWNIGFLITGKMAAAMAVTVALALHLVLFYRFQLSPSIIDLPVKLNMTPAATITGAPPSAVVSRSKKVRSAIESTTLYSLLPEVPFNRPFHSPSDCSPKSSNISPSQITDLSPYQPLDFFELSSSLYRAPRAASLIFNVGQTSPGIGAKAHEVLATLQKSWEQWAIELRRIFVTAIEVVSRMANNEYVKMRDDLSDAKAYVRQRLWDKVGKASEGLYRVTSNTCKSLAAKDTEKRLQDVRKLREKHRAMLRSIRGSFQANLELRLLETVMQAERAKSHAFKTVQSLLGKCAAASEDKALQARHVRRKKNGARPPAKHSHRKKSPANKH